MHHDLDRLLDEVRLLWHAMSRASEQLHGGQPVTVGMRGVLELLTLAGPATVPQLASRRHVSRQHIQMQVNALLDRKLVALDENPKHKRSVVVRLTPKGQRAFATMKHRERGFVDGLSLPTPADLARASETLRAVRESIARQR